MEEELDAQALHVMRTTAKRRHTNLLTQIRTMLNGNASREAFTELMPTVGGVQQRDKHTRTFRAGCRL